MASEIVEGFRLSPQQRHLWLLQQSTRNPVYQVQCEVAVAGQLDTDVLRAALNAIIRRHEILRTTFQYLPGMGIPVQVIDEEVEAVCAERDLSALGEQAQEDAIRELRQEWQQLPFDYERNLLWRAALCTLSSDQYRLLLSLPALCADAASVKILVREIQAAYVAALAGAELEGEPMQYADLSEWQNERLEDAQAGAGRDYWREHDWNALLAQKLPFEKTPATNGEFAPRSLDLTLQASTATRLASVARQHDTSVETFLLACWQLLLWRITGQAEMAYGLVSDGRKYVELEGIVGLLARWLPVRCQLANELSFSEVLRQADESSRDARKWQDYFVPEEITGWSPDNDTFPVCYEYVEAEATPTLPPAPLHFHLLRLSAWSDRFTLKLFCRHHGAHPAAGEHADGSGLEVELQYDAARFDRTDVERLGEQYLRLLESALAASGETEVGELEVVGERERERLVEEFNRTQREVGGVGRCVHELVEEQVARTPEATAVVYEADSLTYAELNERANRLAHYLQGQGVGVESLVGICVERSLEMVIALLATLKAGAAYVPLDPDHPAERLRLMIKEGGISLVLADVKQGEETQPLDVENARVIYLDRDWPEIAQERRENPSSDVRAENLVYAIFTSGSTGKPKSVGVEHRQLVNYVNSILEHLTLPVGASFAMVSTFAADLGNTVLYPSLCTGGTLHLISRARASDPQALADYFKRHPIDCLKIVPGHLDALMTSAHAPDVLPRKCLVLGGEAAHWERVERIRALAPACRVINHYGPTETTVGVLTYPVEGAKRAATVPLGRPLGNIQAYLLDERLRLTPTGAPGEIHIGGDGVSRGYLHHPELTAEKFIPHPFGTAVGKRLYKTGDLGRYLPDGTIEFLGRADHQVKIRGFRLELGEIEAALAAHEAVRQSVVLARGDERGEKRLVAYLVVHDAHRVGNVTSELRDYLRERLPEFMVPASFVTLERMPLTANGKFDRTALAALDEAQLDNRKPYVAPRTLVEEMLAGIWSELLRVEQIGADDNFFELGGHSLLATQLISQLRELFRVELPLRSIFEAPTVALLATEMIAREAKPGQVEKIATALKRIKSMSADDVNEMLQERKQANRRNS